MQIFDFLPIYFISKKLRNNKNMVPNYIAYGRRYIWINKSVVNVREIKC